MKYFAGGHRGLGSHLGRCFYFVEMSTGHPHPSPTFTYINKITFGLLSFTYKGFEHLYVKENNP